MESALSPREIQTRIRSGESVEDVARVAGVDRDRVERFAAPVIAERDHVAGLAMASSARRRGETSSHRTLRGVLTERLLGRGVESTPSLGLLPARRRPVGHHRRLPVGRDAAAGAVLLRSCRAASRWPVTTRARWVLGDSSPSRGPQPGRRPPVPGESTRTRSPPSTSATSSRWSGRSRTSRSLVVWRGRCTEAGAGPGRRNRGASRRSPRSSSSIGLPAPPRRTRSIRTPSWPRSRRELDRLEAEEQRVRLETLYEILEEQDPPTRPGSERAGRDG